VAAKDTIGGGKIMLAKELLKKIIQVLKNRPFSSGTIPEQFPIIKVLHFVAQYRKEVF
jgi:hypothetical protein